MLRFLFFLLIRFWLILLWVFGFPSPSCFHHFVFHSSSHICITLCSLRVTIWLLVKTQPLCPLCPSTIGLLVFDSSVTRRLPLTPWFTLTESVVMSPLFCSTVSLYCMAQSLAFEQNDDPLINNHVFVFIILSRLPFCPQFWKVPLRAMALPWMALEGATVTLSWCLPMNRCPIHGVFPSHA